MENKRTIIKEVFSRINYLHCMKKKEELGQKKLVFLKYNMFPPQGKYKVCQQCGVNINPMTSVLDWIDMSVFLKAVDIEKLVVISYQKSQ